MSFRLYVQWYLVTLFLGVLRGRLFCPVRRRCRLYTIGYFCLEALPRVGVAVRSLKPDIFAFVSGSGELVYVCCILHSLSVLPLLRSFCCFVAAACDLELLDVFRSFLTCHVAHSW